MGIARPDSIRMIDFHDQPEGEVALNHGDAASRRRRYAVPVGATISIAAMRAANRRMGWRRLSEYTLLILPSIGRMKPAAARGGSMQLPNVAWIAWTGRSRAGVAGASAAMICTALKCRRPRKPVLRLDQPGGDHCVLLGAGAVARTPPQKSSAEQRKDCACNQSHLPVANFVGAYAAETAGGTRSNVHHDAAFQIGQGLRKGSRAVGVILGSTPARTWSQPAITPLRLRGTVRLGHTLLVC